MSDSKYKLSKETIKAFGMSKEMVKMVESYPVKHHKLKGLEKIGVDNELPKKSK